MSSVEWRKFGWEKVVLVGVEGFDQKDGKDAGDKDGEILPLGIIVAKKDACAANNDVLAPLSHVFSDKMKQYSFFFIHHVYSYWVFFKTSRKSNLFSEQDAVQD